MSKYKLKKDLPFAKKGTKVRLFFGATNPSVFFNRELQVVDFNASTELTYSQWEWIEEDFGEDRQSVEYWEEKLRERKDTTFKIKANLLDVPELLEAAIKCKASSIFVGADGWVTIGFFFVEKKEVKPRELEVMFAKSTDNPVGIRLEGCKYFDPIGTSSMDASTIPSYTIKFIEVTE